MDYHKAGIKLSCEFKDYILGEVQKSWIQTSGTINKITKGLKNNFTIYYTYQIDGVSYESQQNIHNKEIDIVDLVTKMNQHDPIDVYYNPYNPFEVRLTKNDSSPSFMSFVIFLAVLTIIVYGLKGNYTKFILPIALIIFGIYIYYTRFQTKSNKNIIFCLNSVR
jgi:hypothetical protein